MAIHRCVSGKPKNGTFSPPPHQKGLYPPQHEMIPEFWSGIFQRHSRKFGGFSPDMGPKIVTKIVLNVVLLNYNQAHRDQRPQISGITCLTHWFFGFLVENIFLPKSTKSEKFWLIWNYAETLFQRTKPILVHLFKVVKKPSGPHPPWKYLWYLGNWGYFGN